MVSTLPHCPRCGRRRLIRFETPAGKQAQVDFAFFKTVFTDQPDVERIVWLFSFVLGLHPPFTGAALGLQLCRSLLR
jgi:hypothetical protein